MKAVAYQQCLPIAHAESLLDVDLPEPAPGPHDLLVEIRAVAANPLDTKMRARAQPAPGHCKVLGWDASGMVRAVGADVTLFQPGDRVWYAGSLQRPGSNSEVHLVDERLAGTAPKSLDFAAAAALPLTTITAWEMLFERLAISPGKHHHGQSILIVGAAGGVGSILTQLARRLTGLKVIATASRPETAQWVRELGAHEVIDHMRPLGDELRRINAQAPNYVVSLTNTAKHYAAIAQAIAPQEVRAHRRSGNRRHRHRTPERKERFAALGVHVHALHVCDQRHDRAAQSAQRGCGACRFGGDPHDPG